MIKISIKDLIPIMSDLINLFLSGFIFVYIYNWFNNKKMDISTLTIWSLFISALIKSLYSTIHIFILSSIEIPNAVKIIIYSLTGFLLAILLTQLKNTKKITHILYKVNNKSINDDIFDDIFDYDKKTMLKIYIKSSNVYYIGRFSFREENGINSWISLVEYNCMAPRYFMWVTSFFTYNQMRCFPSYSVYMVTPITASMSSLPHTK